MKKRFKKKAVALSLALAIAATTNTGGLQNVVKIHAGTTYYGTYKESINGVDWEVDYEINVGSGPASYRNISTKVTNKDALANKKIEIPEKIGNCTITVISAECFANTDISEVIFTENIKTIEERAFHNCSKLKYVEFKGTDIPAGCFSLCDSLEEIKLSGSGTVTIGQSAFYQNTSLKKLEIADTISALAIKDLAFYGDTLLSDVSTLPDITLGNGSFAYCGNLKELTFNGSVKYIRTDHKHTDYSTFFGAFEKSDEEKKVTFNGDANIPSNCFDSCTGLNKVSINSTATLNDYAFKNCKNLSNVQFGAGKITLGSLVFSSCSSLKELHFNSDVNMVQNPTLGGKNWTYRMYEGEVADASIGACSCPFENSSIEKIRFDNGNVNIYIGSASVKEIYFNATELCGGLGDCSNLDTVVFENSNQLGGLDYKYEPYYTFLNKCTHKCTIVGYSSTDLEYRIVENWINELAQNVKEKITFKNIISSDSLSVTYDGKIVSDNPTIEDFDKTKLKVSAGYYDFVNKTYNVIDINPSTDDTDVTGYVAILPKSLHNGSNMFTVSFSGWTKTATVEVTKKTPKSIKVDWKENEINQLVSNQPITSADVISGACITYNNGDTEIVTADKLTLNKSITVAGDNNFVATLTGTDIKEEKRFTIKQNYINSIKAEYPSDKTLYVGDEIDISKIKLTPTYKYDGDTTVNRNITATNCETELKEVGANTLKVYYNDIETTMVVSAAAVAPTKLYAMFDTNYTYVEGQKSIDPKSIVTKIEYNNGTSKTIASEEITYEIIQQTSSELQVKVSYAGLESVVAIPVTPKQIVAIKAKANIASATEGATLPKTVIDHIEVAYNNGNTETLDSTAINYDELTFNDYAIVADTQNVITVNYLGKSAEIIIVGISNTITNIYAEYIGSGQIVGTEVPVSDVAVHAINSNGQVTDVTTGVLLENAVPYNVGNNIVTVHYGSLSCTVTVNGLPAPEVPSGTPSTTADVTDKEPVKTEAPVNTLAPTNKPEVPFETPSAAPTVPAPANSPVVTVSTPDNANSAPIAANTTVTLKASNAKIAAATTDTYKVYTNKNVVIEIAAVAASNIKYQIVAKGAKVSDTAWKDVTDNKITVSKTAKPSIVYIQYKDASGAVQTIHTNGFTVDMKKATVNIKQNKTYKIGKKLTFKDASGIKTAKLDGKKIKSGVKLKKKGLHILVVTDKAGNQTVIKFKIK